ncbi:MAG: polysaccharide biosynthesis protein [Clostridia bacterium]|nr:polysaccharide biosynthesis protein [Clostridia bacterium]
MANAKKQSLLNGALILSAAIVLVKILSVLFKLYVANRIGYGGTGLYATAYNIYTPIYSIALAGLPTAVSKMVASELAQGHYKDVKRLFGVSNMLFAFMGLVGMAVMLLLSYPYALSVGAVDAMPSIIAIAPSIFFCCVMSGYRGYYQGYSNMNPSAVSQIFEAAGKLIFGWLFLNMVTGSALTFADKIPILKDIVTDKGAAYASAAAIAGVSVGSLMGLVYLIIRSKAVKDNVTRSLLEASPEAKSRRVLARRLVAIAIPIAISSLVFNVTTLIDNWTIQNRLKAVLENGYDTVAKMYPGIVEARGFTRETAIDFKTYLFGAYDMVLEIKNVVPTFTITLGLSAIPILSESWTKKDIPSVRRSVETMIRLCMLIAFPAGVGMMVLSDDLLYLLFGASEVNAPAIPYIAPILMFYGFSVFSLALTQPLTSALQAIDRVDVPIKAMAIGAAVKIAANFILVSIPSVNIQGAVFGSILCNMVMVVYSMIVLAKETGVKYSWNSLFIKPFICAVISGAAAWLTNSIFEKALPENGLTFIFSRLTVGNLACVAAVLAAVIFYVISLFALRAVTKEEISMLPKGKKIAKTLEKYGLIG